MTKHLWSWSHWFKPMNVPSLIPHPLSVVILAVSAIGGFSILIGGPRSVIIPLNLSPYIIDMWAVLLIMGSVICAVGLLWRRALTGILIERAGVFALFPALVLYVAAAFITEGFNAFTYPVLLVVAFTIGKGLRLLQIQRFIWHTRYVAKGL